MPVVSDFVVIQGDNPVVVGEPPKDEFNDTFNTGGRWPNGGAILMLMVRGLTATDKNVSVVINGKPVGWIYNHKGANKNHWFTQIINIGKGVLKNGNNSIRIEGVSWKGAKPGNIIDDFAMKNIICFFQQNA